MARSDLVMVARVIRRLTVTSWGRISNVATDAEDRSLNFCLLRHTESCVHRTTCSAQINRHKDPQVDEKDSGIVALGLNYRGLLDSTVSKILESILDLRSCESTSACEYGCDEVLG